jgi:hypothetical protein
MHPVGLEPTIPVLEFKTVHATVIGVDSVWDYETEKAVRAQHRAVEPLPKETL